MASWPYNTAAWRRLRLEKLHASPLCEACRAEGILRTANTVDHRVAISQGGPAFPDLDGLASLCPAHHSRKTARSAEAGAVKTTKPVRGCDVDGWPLDPAHPWNAKGEGEKGQKPNGWRPPPNLRTQLVSKRD